MNQKQISQLSNQELMMALSHYCGIHTESQLQKLFASVHIDTEQTLIQYGFATKIRGELELTMSGVICTEVILRFMPDNN